MLLTAVWRVREGRQRAVSWEVCVGGSRFIVLWWLFWVFMSFCRLLLCVFLPHGGQ